MLLDCHMVLNFTKDKEINYQNLFFELLLTKKISNFCGRHEIIEASGGMDPHILNI